MIAIICQVFSTKLKKKKKTYNVIPGSYEVSFRSLKIKLNVGLLQKKFIQASEESLISSIFPENVLDFQEKCLYLPPDIQYKCCMCGNPVKSTKNHLEIQKIY